MRLIRRAFLIACVAALLPACGGGGGNGPATAGGGFDAEGVLESGGVGRGVTSLLVSGPWFFIGTYEPTGPRWFVEKRDAVTGRTDPGFGSDGRVESGGSVVDLQTDGTWLYLIGGNMSLAGDTAWRIEKRSLATGALDAAFASGGALISNPSPYYDWAHAAMVDGGAIYIVGSDMSPHVPPGPQFTQWRIEKYLTADGSPDSAFDGDGVIAGPIGDAYDVAVSGGAIYVCGSDIAAIPGPSRRWRVEKRDAATGTLDSAFGDNGAFFDNPAQGSDEAFKIVHDGMFLWVAGHVDPTVSDGLWRIRKMNPDDGQPVTSFGTGGVLDRDVAPEYTETLRAFVVDGDELFVAGDEYSNLSDSRWLVERRTAGSGAPIPTWGQLGTLVVNPHPLGDGLIAVAVSPDAIYVAAMTADSQSWRVEKRAR